jgi:hypothetical protein
MQIELRQSRRLQQAAVNYLNASRAPFVTQRAIGNFVQCYGNEMAAGQAGKMKCVAAD